MHYDKRPTQDEWKPANCSSGGLSRGGIYSHETPGKGVLTAQWLGRYLRIGAVPEGEPIYRVGQMVRLRLISDRYGALLFVDWRNWPNNNALFFTFVPAELGSERLARAVLARCQITQDGQD